MIGRRGRGGACAREPAGGEHNREQHTPPANRSSEASPFLFGGELYTLRRMPLA